MRDVAMAIYISFRNSFFILSMFLLKLRFDKNSATPAVFVVALDTSVKVQEGVVELHFEQDGIRISIGYRL